MMGHSRYSFLRNRAIKLYNILNNRQYQVWIAPKTMMDLDALRNRDVYTQEGFAPDPTYFDEYQVRKLRIPDMAEFLKNVTGPNELGFQNPNVAVIEIYESIQEYCALWCEILVDAPEFSGPPMAELRFIEHLAYYLFPMYKQIKPFKTNEALDYQLQTDEALNKRGLLGLGMLFQVGKQQEEISFISHLDAFEQRDTVSMDNLMAERPFVPSTVPVDSLANIAMNNDTADWVFRS